MMNTTTNRKVENTDSKLGWMMLLHWINSNEQDMTAEEWDSRYYVKHTVEDVLCLGGISNKEESEMLHQHPMVDLESDFQIACGDGKMDVVLSLIDKVDITAAKNLALRWAKYEGHDDIVKLLEDRMEKMK